MLVFVFDTLSPLKRVAHNCRKCYATTFAYSHLWAVEQFNWLFRINGWRCQPSSRNLCFTGRCGVAASLKSQVVLLQRAHYWANAGVLLGARMHRISHASGAGELSKQLHFRRYVLCCFPTNSNSHARIVPIFAQRYDVDIRRFERQRLKYTFALFRSHF